MAQRLIGVFTGNRAEYGLQQPILRAIADHPDLDYRLIVSGAHLDGDFGETRSEIEADGFTIHAEVAIDLATDSLSATPRAIGSGVIGICDALDRLRPDVLVVYADRFEGFAAVIAASQMGVPTAHVEGGDLTEGGALDDSVRHAMSKLAHLHFTTNAQATNRLLAMGEEAWRVHTVGFPVIDNIAAGRFAPPQELADALELDLARPIVVFTQHSVATEDDDAEGQIAASLDALRALGASGAQVILTYPNNDAGGRRIISALEAAMEDAPAGLQLHRSLGRWRYQGLLALANDAARRVVCAGNSSSGIKETPAFGCPSINIGSRQRGRLRAVNVIDVDYDAAAIRAAIERGLNDEAFLATCRAVDNPYGLGDAGLRIVRLLAEVPIDRKLIQKRMTLRGEVGGGWYR